MMKNTKKIFAFVLFVSIAMTLCPMVLAEQDIGFSAVDNFDSLELTDDVFNKYPNASLGQTSEVFGQSTNTQKGFNITEAEGPDGKVSKVLEITNRNGDYVILPFASSFIHKEGMVTQLSYDIRFTKLPGDNPTDKARTGTAFLRFGSNGFKNAGQDSILTAPGGASITMQKDFWYKMVGKVNTDGRLTVYLLDAKSGDILIEAETSKTFGADSEIDIKAAYLQATNTVLADGTKIYITCQIDNAEVIQYDPSTPPEISSASIENGETEVIRNKALTLNFNQGLAPDSYVTLTSEKGDEVNLNVSASAFGKLTISFNELLERKTEYTLSLAGVKNENNVAFEADDITFTTEDLHIWNEIEILSVSAGDATQISFTLSDIYGYPTFSGMVMAAAYEGGKMTGIDIVELDEASTESELTKSFNIGSISDQTEIQLMLLDKVYGPVPLASGTCAG